MGKKYFIVADVHSYHDEMRLALYRAGFNINDPDHIVISLGDLLDRGPKPLECLRFFNSLPRERKVLIRGNHERLMRQMIDRGIHTITDILNGTYKTTRLLVGDNIADMNNFEPWIQYEKDLTNYYITPKSIFVHGWIPDTYEDWNDAAFADACWLNGMQQWQLGKRMPDKTIYCGHWYTGWGHKHLHNEDEECVDPFIDDGIVALDASTSVSGKVNCFVIEE